MSCRVCAPNSISRIPPRPILMLCPKKSISLPPRSALIRCLSCRISLRVQKSTRSGHTKGVRLFRKACPSARSPAAGGALFIVGRSPVSPRSVLFVRGGGGGRGVGGQVGLGGRDPAHPATKKLFLP